MPKPPQKPPQSGGEGSSRVIVAHDQGRVGEAPGSQPASDLFGGGQRMASLTRIVLGAREVTIQVGIHGTRNGCLCPVPLTSSWLIERKTAVDDPHIRIVQDLVKALGGNQGRGMVLQGGDQDVEGLNVCDEREAEPANRLST